MTPVAEKFEIKITENGVSIQSGEGVVLDFTAVEALMLLDILKNEAPTLQEMAKEASPLPMRVQFQRTDGPG